MYQLLKHLLLPPTNFLIIGILGLVRSRRREGAGRWMAIGSFLALTILSMPAVGGYLLYSLQDWPPGMPAPASAMGAGTIVVLGAETAVAPEYHATDVGPLSLVRVRYAARLHALTGLPILASGGPARTRLAEAMATALHEDFHVPEVWVEPASTTTWENARFSAEILRRKGIGKVLLVTHAWHMRRAMASFTAAGIEAVPAPTGEVSFGQLDALAFLPSYSGLRDSFFACHEYAGNAYYRLRARLGW